MASGDFPRRSRRFLPRDPRVEEPYRLTPQLAFRVAILAFLALGIFAVLFLRLWALQVLSGDALPRAWRTTTACARFASMRRAARSSTATAGARRQRRRHARRAVAGRSPEDVAGGAGGAACALAGHRDRGTADPRARSGRRRPTRSRPSSSSAASSATRSSTSRSMRRSSPACGSPRAGCAPTRTGARGAGARLRRPDLADRSTRRSCRAGLPADRRHRPVGRRVALRHVSARARRHGAADGRLARPAEGRRGRRDHPPTPGEALRLTLDINLQRAAEKALAYGIQPRAQQRGRAVRRRRRDRRARPERRAPCSRWRRIRRTSRRSSRAPEREEARAAAQPRGRRARQPPGHEPRDRRRLPAGLDVQAGDRARRDAGAHPHAVRAAPLHARRSRRTSRCSTTGRR